MKLYDGGTLVNIMNRNDNFLSNPATCYKQYLGAIPILNHENVVTNVYTVYEDFDGTIKYFDYPQ